MGVLLNILVLAGGIAALIIGGDLLVRGSVTIAIRLGVKPLVIGLTVVAFGTSAPELALNMVAAARDNTALAFGNIIGSNIANIGLIIGLLALLKPLKVNASLIRHELPIMMIITAIALALGAVAFIDPGPPPGPSGAAPLARSDDAVIDAASGWPGFSRIDGVAMLICFVVFLSWTVRTARQPAVPEDIQLERETTDEIQAVDSHRPTWRANLFVLAGLALLIAGGQGAEFGASGIALALSMTPELIGLTIVAVSTSLPELFAGLMAIRRNQVDIAVGNVVGSNIFNLGLVLGATAIIAPVPVPEGGIVALAVMTLLSVAIVPMCFTAQRTIDRREGGLLLLIYVAYIASLAYNALS